MSYLDLLYNCDMRWIIIFLGVLLLALVAQNNLWKQGVFIDRQMWIDHVQDVHELNEKMLAPTVYGHPGTLLVEVAIIARSLLGVSYEQALYAAMAMINALVIAAIAVVCCALRPHSWWWLLAVLLLLFNRLYTIATPPSALAAPFVVLITLLGWLMYERADRSARLLPYGWGLIVGLSAAVRFDITVAVAVALLLFLAARLGLPAAIRSAVAASVSFFVANPFMWFFPVKHISDLMAVINHHYTEYGTLPQQLGIWGLFNVSPIAVIGFVVAIIVVCLNRRMRLISSVSYLAMLIALTVVIVTIILNSRFQAARYFFPLAFLWEVILAWLLLEAIPRLKFNFLRQPRWRSLSYHAALVVLLRCWRAGNCLCL